VKRWQAILLALAAALVYILVMAAFLTLVRPQGADGDVFWVCLSVVLGAPAGPGGLWLYYEIDGRWVKR